MSQSQRDPGCHDVGGVTSQEVSVKSEASYLRRWERVLVASSIAVILSSLWAVASW